MTDDMLHVMKWHNGEKEYSLRAAVQKSATVAAE